MYERFSDRSNRLGIEAFDTMMAGMSRQDSINLGGGTLHPTLTPLQQLFSLMERIPSADLGRIMAYCPARGLPEMIEAHREYLSAFRRFTAAEDEVCIVNGGTQGLDLVLQAILDPGDVMLVEQPTFLTIYPLARKLQVRCVGVRLDDKGIDLEDLERKAETSNPKLLYIIPTYQNPSGTVLSKERREKVYDIARRHGLFILEDDPYYDLSVSGDVPPALRSMDKDGRVAMVSSYSKIIAPGLRVGAVNAPAKVIKAVAGLKQCADMHTSGLSQYLCARMIDTGLLGEHVMRLRKDLSDRIGTLQSQLMTWFPKGTVWTRPEGGIFAWVQLPGAVRQAGQAVERDGSRVTFMPGDAFFLEDGPSRYVRLNYAGPDLRALGDGIRILGQFFKEAYEQGS